MQTKEIWAKSVLTKSGIPGYDYCINPYVGCQHGCTFCYAAFMKRFTGHDEPWGEFVDIKLNAPEVLNKQLARAKKGLVGLGTVTDPYQPLEKEYQITRGCLEALVKYQFPVSLLTRSPLCTRDTDLFKELRNVDVGLSIATDDERIKKHFEPNSPTIKSRIAALRELHDAGIKTYAFIGPMLPLDAEKLAESLCGIVDYVLIDRLNYAAKVVSLYRRLNLQDFLSYEYFSTTGLSLKMAFERRGTPATLLFT